MLEHSPTAAMTCARCGKSFSGNPRNQPLGSANYCSITCEEGRSRLPISDPRSPDFHLHLKGEPEALVGMTLIADGFKCDAVVGRVVDYDGEYHVEYEDMETGEIIERTFNDFLVVEQIRKNRWWAHN